MEQNKSSKILYISKINNRDNKWSSAINDLFEESSYLSTRIINFYLDTSSLKTICDSCISLIKKDVKKNDTIIFNHAITFWGLFPIFLYLKIFKTKFIFLIHEHEHILGLKYFFINITKMKIRQLPIYTKLWYKIPSYVSKYVICLSSQQCDVLRIKNYFRISYLGIKETNFPPKSHLDNQKNKDKYKILFPHDTKRYDKGYRFCIPLYNINYIKIVLGREVLYDYDKVYLKYHNADIVFLPSDSESYSLVLIEALCTNSVIVTNRNVGVVKLLLSKYSVLELEKQGLFISDHNFVSYKIKIDQSITFLKEDSIILTHQLFQEFKFDLNSASTRFMQLINDEQTL